MLCYSRNNCAMIKRATSQDGFIKSALRLPPALHEKVTAAAALAGRSLNAELIERIAAAEDRVQYAELLQQNAELKAMLREVLDTLELLKRR
jgi:hypothetical protein